MYYCQFPGCERQFVRQDLRTRHRERHTARGLHLQKQEQSAQISEDGSNTPPPSAYLRKQGVALGTIEHTRSKDVSIDIHAVTPGVHVLPSVVVRSLTAKQLTQPKLDFNSALPIETVPDPDYPAESGPVYDAVTTFHTKGYEQQFHYPPAVTFQAVKSEELADAFLDDNISPGGRVDSYRSRPILNPSINGDVSRSNDPTYGGGSTSDPSSSAAYNTHAGNTDSSQAALPAEMDSESCMSNQEVRSLPPLPRSSLSSIPSTPPAPHSNYIHTSASLSPVKKNGVVEAQDLVAMDLVAMDRNPSLVDLYSHPLALPIFDAHTYGLSPAAMAEDFTSWLFSAPQLGNATPINSRHGLLSTGQTTFMEGPGSMTYGSEGGLLNGQYAQSMPTQHRMNVNNILDTAITPTILSDEKRKELLDLIDLRFIETDQTPVSKRKKHILSGDRNTDSHVLSLKMLKTYIGSYWYHFHPQMPILHQPTFSPDQTKNLLLLVIIAIGASSLDRLHGESVTTAGANLSDFLAWHLRDEIFKDIDFSPPAKLWVFQTLILLEIYEKMYSTRVLHERAHIHHGTTLTLMRRGSNFLGGSADSSLIKSSDGFESPQAVNHRSLHHSTPEQWWNNWIMNEATRRVAFAAFIIDSIHASMFGHSANMAAHEMKLTLPCDEAAWSATSIIEVVRIESNLLSNGIVPITFHDGLKLTLNSNPLQTNPFGRTAVIAGLLNVGWHMHQRDLQIRSLGAVNNMGGREIWKGTLARAFQSWRDDFDQSMDKNWEPFSTLYQASATRNNEIIFESRIVLQHLAHMATHVDIVSCQIYAKAPRLLGRIISSEEYFSVMSRMRETWALKACARHATFFALKFLTLTLVRVPPATTDPRSASETLEIGEEPEYSARDDFLLNRLWALYFAALTVWTYGFALDGPVTNVPALNTFEQEKCDMRRFLQRVGGLRSPDDLENMRDRNSCIGMLLVLQRMFKKCRWELIHEAASLLENCIKMSKGA